MIKLNLNLSLNYLMIFYLKIFK